MLDLSLCKVLVDRLENAPIPTLDDSLADYFPLLCRTVLFTLHDFHLIFFTRLLFLLIVLF